MHLWMPAWRTPWRHYAPWERVKKIVILAEPFTIAAEELTVSLKLRRQAILFRHQALLDKIYSQPLTE